MSLLTKNTKTSATLASQIQSGGAHLAAFSAIVNSMVGTLINLNNEDATAWLNAQVPSDVERLFTAHYQVGLATNGLQQIFGQLMAESEIVYAATAVDIRPVSEKLADQGRELLVSAAGFVVQDIVLPPPVDPPVDPEAPPVDPPVDPEAPPVDPEAPPVDPEAPPVDPPVDPGA